jgi:hypothetical protein
MSVQSHNNGERHAEQGQHPNCKTLHSGAPAAGEGDTVMAFRLWTAAIASLVPLMACSGPPPASAARAGTAVLAEPQAAPPTAGTTRVPVRYYVAPNGSDAASGTAAAPFRTIQQGADAAGPGDTVIVRAGVYTGGSRVVELQRGGAPGAWVTFRSDRPGGAILEGSAGEGAEAWYFGRNVGYVRVEGFEIRNFQEHGFNFYGGGVHDIVIAQNRVHHIGRNCTDTDNGRTGASLGAGAHRVMFDGNIWHDIGRLKPGEGGCSPRNHNYQNHDHGIYVADADEITIRNNVFFAFAGGWAVHRYSSRGFETRKLVIVNNTFLGQNPYRAGQVILATATSGLRVENNIFHAPNEAALYFENLRFPGGLVRNNMVHHGVMKTGRPRGVTFATNRENTDPMLNEADARLEAGSPAIDAGWPLTDVPFDAAGVGRPRGAGYDLGAFER